MLSIKMSSIEDTFKTLDDISEAKAKKSIRVLTTATYKTVKRLAKKHRDTGVMETNIRHRVKGQAGIVWIDDANMLVNFKGRKVNYAIFVLFGTKPHTIVPKDKKVLMWGKFHFAKRVEHKGYKGDNFMNKALNTTFNNVERLLNGI